MARLATAQGSPRPLSASLPFAFLLLCLPAALGAQGPESPVDAEGPVRVFFDCEGQLCDFDFYRREIPYVTWVRDRRVADVHLLVTEEDTGGGGERFNLDFIGVDRFDGLERRLTYASDPTQTEAEQREGFLRRMEFGLINYVAETPAAVGLSIDFDEEVGGGPESVVQVDDPWNRWVFDVELGGSYESEARVTSLSADGGLSVNRTTPAWKFDAFFGGEYSESRFDVGEEEDFVSIQRRLGLEGILVRSLGGNWSAGGQFSVRESSRLNQDLAVRAGPALEYSVFPYEESSRRQLTFLYAVSGERFAYQDTTVFGELSEMRISQVLNISLDAQQPWGELNLSIEGAHFLRELQQNRVSIFGRMEWQVLEGFSLDLEASASRIRDQIYLPAEEASDEEILVGEREFATDFETEFEIGLSYTFGSIFSDIVNTRFESLTGGGDRGRF